MSGIVNGAEYTVVDRAMLDLMIENNEDPSKACTSRVNDMSYLMSYYIPVDFPIGNWDVSNVTNMEIMFDNTDVFNQPIEHWDLSSVNPLYGMFHNAAKTGFSQAYWRLGCE